MTISGTDTFGDHAAVPRGYRGRHFMAIRFADGLLADHSTDRFPTRMYGWGFEGRELLVEGADTHFGFVLDGEAVVTTEHLNWSRSFTLSAGMYFSVAGGARVRGGKGIVVSRLGCHGMFLVGGPIETTGRLRYIDGCSDSLLVPPVVKGDPCLNYLHFPAHVNQTRHTHPSLRVGIVARGRGRCIIPTNDDGTGPDVTVPLVPGQLFIIPTDGHHSFFTDDEPMDVIAYHPDSDTGPEHENHPVLNRTIVKGVSASNLPGIQTA